MERVPTASHQAGNEGERPETENVLYFSDCKDIKDINRYNFLLELRLKSCIDRMYYVSTRIRSNRTYSVITIHTY